MIRDELHHYPTADTANCHYPHSTAKEYKEREQKKIMMGAKEDEGQIVIKRKQKVRERKVMDHSTSTHLYIFTCNPIPKEAMFVILEACGCIFCMDPSNIKCSETTNYCSMFLERRTGVRGMTLFVIRGHCAF